MRDLRTLLFLLIALQPFQAFGQTAQRDGQNDFDSNFGTWKTHLRRLQRPLTDSTTWVEYEGTTVVSKVWNGRANLVELKVSGPAGSIEGLSLRLFTGFGSIRTGLLGRWRQDVGSELDSRRHAREVTEPSAVAPGQPPPSRMMD